MIYQEKKYSVSSIEKLEENIQICEDDMGQREMGMERLSHEVPIINVQEVKSLTSIDQNQQFEYSYEKDQFEPIQHQKTQQQDSQQQSYSPGNQAQQIPQPQSINISNTSIDVNFENLQFQVVIHKVNSRQSLHENGNHLIQFTKSELEIPLDVDGQQASTVQPGKTEYVNIWKKQDSDTDNFYAKILEDKWTKKEEQNNSVQKPLSHEDPKRQAESQSQSFGIFNILQELSKVTNQTTNTANNKKEEIHKKSYFHIKKMKQDRSVCSALNNRDFCLKSPKTSKQQQSNRFSANQSQFINVKKQKSPLMVHRFSKNNLSNFSSTKNSSIKPKTSSRKVEQHVQYEVILGNQGETMNKILEDRTYNCLMTPSIKRDHSHPIFLKFKQNEAKSAKSSQIPIKTIRKVIKRSPYGVLQLEVKETNNQAKITNLRILKPKDMIRLKKIPKIVKNFKQNVVTN